MKMIIKTVPKVVGFFLILTLLCGVAFPMVVTGISGVLFPKQATGSLLIGEDGTKYGSEHLGQQFTKEEYLWGRVMNVDTTTFQNQEGAELMYGWASNKSPAGAEFQDIMASRVEYIRKAHPDQTGMAIPQDLVTSSGSGLDPGISPSAAKFQLTRIAKARGVSTEEVAEIVDQYTTKRTFGLFGEPTVHVLKVNLALDGITWSE